LANVSQRAGRKEQSLSNEEPGKFMQQLVSVEYDMKPSPEQVAHHKELAQHRIVGHRCPECGLTYVPGSGYCPICAVVIGEAGRVVLEPRGTVTTFTVVEPLQYQGQQEKSPYVVAAILLDGAGVALGQQRLGEIEPSDARIGMRVEVEWAEAGAASPIQHWGPNGEPDVPRDQLQEHIL
jgi:hypothetical protein